MDIQHILIAVDLSTHANRAVEGVVRWLRGTGGAVKVTLLHVDETPALGVAGAQAVVELMTRIADARAQRLGGLAKLIHDAGGEVAVEVAAGVPYEEIMRCAKELSVDMIVVAKRGEGEGPLMGSTTRRVLERSPCAVLVLPPQEMTPGDGYRKVVVTTDMGDESAQGLLVALLVARRMKGEVLVVHALRVPMMVPIIPGETPLQLPQDSIEHLQSLEGGALQAWVDGVAKGEKVRSRLAVGGSVARGVLEVAKEEAAELVVVPSQGKGRIARFFLGSVAMSVAEQAQMAVLVLPPARTEEG
jgi:nucleotide-binding universal stress UspA family protein